MFGSLLGGLTNLLAQIPLDVLPVMISPAWSLQIKPRTRQ
jgi:hypothetical protein